MASSSAFLYLPTSSHSAVVIPLSLRGNTHLISGERYARVGAWPALRRPWLFTVTIQIRFVRYLAALSWQDVEYGSRSPEVFISFEKVYDSHASFPKNALPDSTNIVGPSGGESYRSCSGGQSALPPDRRSGDSNTPSKRRHEKESHPEKSGNSEDRGEGVDAKRQRTGDAETKPGGKCPKLGLFAPGWKGPKKGNFPCVFAILYPDHYNNCGTPCIKRSGIPLGKLKEHYKRYHSAKVKCPWCKEEWGGGKWDDEYINHVKVQHRSNTPWCIENHPHIMQMEEQILMDIPFGVVQNETSGSDKDLQTKWERLWDIFAPKGKPAPHHTTRWPPGLEWPPVSNEGRVVERAYNETPIPPDNAEETATSTEQRDESSRPRGSTEPSSMSEGLNESVEADASVMSHQRSNSGPQDQGAEHRAIGDQFNHDFDPGVEDPMSNSGISEGGSSSGFSALLNWWESSPDNESEQMQDCGTKYDRLTAQPDEQRSPFSDPYR